MSAGGIKEGIDPARKRAAVETYTSNEASLRRTARRYSICVDDAEEALQRGLEVLLHKAPTEDPRELIRWTQTVVKHEALAVRRERERILSGPAAAKHNPNREDWVALIPTGSDGPAEQALRREEIARSREALQALKPQELRALTLLAQGYSYVEIGEITGYSQTKINRCLAEGRERFRRIVAGSEDGSRCAEMGPLLSAFCDGEAAASEVATVREHLRACLHCRAALRAYRVAPLAASALLPTLPVHRSLFERAHDGLAGLISRLTGAPSDSALQQVTAGGGLRGMGTVALAKAAAICVGTVGGVACVAGGVVPMPLEIGGSGHSSATQVERSAELRLGGAAVPTDESDSDTHESTPSLQPERQPKEVPPARERQRPPASAQPLTAGGAVESAPPSTEPAAPLAPVEAPAESTAAAAPEAGNAAGEFGP